MAIRPPHLHPAVAALAALLFALTLHGCASTSAPRTSTPAAHAACPQLLRASSGITADDIATLRPMDLYEALRWYRPSYLQGRSSRSGDIVVYVDGLAVGGIDNLHDVRAVETASVTLLTPAEATLRFGPRYPGGVLLVRTNRATTAGRCPTS